MYKTKHDAKSVFECFAGRVEYDNRGKIIKKYEVWAQDNGKRERHSFLYFYAPKGHLTHVYHNGMLTENYRLVPAIQQWGRIN